MAVEAENKWLESMGFSQYTLFNSNDFYMGSVLGIEDGFFGINDPILDSYEQNLQAPSSSSSLACFGSAPLEQSLASELENQRVEMDWFLQLENKRLMKLILEEQKRQQAVLLLECESRIKNLILQKDKELALAMNKTSELQDFIRVAEMETKAWEKKAIEKGALAADLQTRLNQLQINKFPNPGDDDDAVSFCDSSCSSSSSRGVKSKNEKIKGGYCKLCQDKSLCVVYFPCRHLCCCKSCEPLLGHCPICQTVKEGCLEVFWG
ncbi:hypothetical protein CASFOL_015968 [Castilleja foliolosa]|uniref:RING-type domain-containing protein n=1 Tax=Castilleja foliolosa TaxID=1961234 RepID=A0ABD3DF89_9LAMI